MNVFKQILCRKEIEAKVPILVDIGASGQIHKSWVSIARYSVCIAFDADERDFGFVTKESSRYKKLHIFNYVVSEKENAKTDFYLTRSPYCSSLLEPDIEALKVWAFADKFEVERKTELKSITLNRVLGELELDRIDWFKTDSQGTDLRLFKTLNQQVADRVLVAEFEPGIIDAYKGEDKFFDLLQYMDKKNFWISSIKIRGSQRIIPGDLRELSPSRLFQQLIQFSHRASPCWAEITFMNTFEGEFSIREYLLGWLFATMHLQYGFASYLAQKGYDLFKDQLFNDMYEYSIKKMKQNVFLLRFFPIAVKRVSMIRKVIKHCILTYF
jgi:hypothetical protein